MLNHRIEDRGRCSGSEVLGSVDVVDRSSLRVGEGLDRIQTRDAVVHFLVCVLPGASGRRNHLLEKPNGCRTSQVLVRVLPRPGLVGDRSEVCVEARSDVIESYGSAIGREYAAGNHVAGQVDIVDRHRVAVAINNLRRVPSGLSSRRVAHLRHFISRSVRGEHAKTRGYIGLALGAPPVRSQKPAGIGKHQIVSEKGVAASVG